VDFHEVRIYEVQSDYRFETALYNQIGDIRPKVAKTSIFLLPGFRAAAPPSKSSKTLLSLFQRCDHLRRPRHALGLPAHAPSRKPDAPLWVRRSSREKLIA